MLCALRLMQTTMLNLAKKRYEENNTYKRLQYDCLVQRKILDKSSLLLTLHFRDIFTGDFFLAGSYFVKRHPRSLVDTVSYSYVHILYHGMRTKLALDMREM